MRVLNKFPGTGSNFPEYNQLNLPLFMGPNKNVNYNSTTSGNYCVSQQTLQKIEQKSHETNLRESVPRKAGSCSAGRQILYQF